MKIIRLVLVALIYAAMPFVYLYNTVRPVKIRRSCVR
jgi:hypothetical protein